MQQLFQHSKKILLLFIAIQILTNGMFAQDVLCNSGEEGIVLSTTNFIAKNVFHHTSNSPRNKHQKHRQTSLKHGVVKFVSHSLISIQKFENRLAVNNFHYSIFFPSYVDDIAPVPPEA